MKTKTLCFIGQNPKNSAVEFIIGGTECGMSVIRYRKKNYVRGMCHCVWHDKEGWQLSEQTEKTDAENFKELNITSWRNWGDANDNMLLKFGSMGCTLAPTMRNKVPASCYADGKPSGNRWASAAEREAFAQRMLEMADIEHTELIETYLLGNEQSMKGWNLSKQLVFSGYDPETQEKFKNEWLKNRFGTIERLNLLCGTDFDCFNAVNAEKNKRLSLEYWMFLRESFESFLQYGIDALHLKKPEIKFGYARLMGRANPTCDDADCDGMETATQNLYWHWWRDFSRYSCRLDALCTSGERPVYITEVGFMSLYSRETEELAARRFKQLLPLLYMRPQIAGSYVFCYSGQLPKNNPLVAEYTWGLCRPDRTRRPSFYSVKQLYSDFKLLDGILGNFHTVQLAAITDQLTDELMSQAYDCDKTARVMYAFGVPLRFVRGDKKNDILNLEINRLIVSDMCLYSSPDGAESEAKSIKSYISKPENKAVTLNGGDFKQLYGGDIKIDGVIRIKTDKTSPSNTWRVLAPFIHGDFAAGNFKPQNSADRLRILDAAAKNKYQLWDIQQQLLYTEDGGAVLAIVNTGSEPADEITVTLGFYEGCKLQKSPSVICADGCVTAAFNGSAEQPDWIKGECKAELLSLTVKNLDTYAFIML